MPVCPQPSRGPFGSLGTFEGHTTAQSEDCLHLNVWSPRLDPAAMLPVVVYIHGGAGKHGAGMLPHFDGMELAAEDVCYGPTRGVRRDLLLCGPWNPLPHSESGGTRLKPQRTQSQSTTV